MRNFTKTITILMMVLITFTSCNCQKKTVESSAAANEKLASDMQLVYEANTRGYFNKITIQNQEMYVSKDRNSKELGTSVKISDADWKELVGYFNAVKLENLATFKDPTQKRFYDGAAIANLKVNHSGKEYHTVDFDNGFPPVEIEKLVNKITSLGTKE